MSPDDDVELVHGLVISKPKPSPPGGKATKRKASKEIPQPVLKNEAGDADAEESAGKGKANRSSKKEAKKERTAEEEDGEESVAPTTKKLKLQGSGSLQRH